MIVISDTSPITNLAAISKLNLSRSTCIKEIQIPAMNAKGA